MTDAQDSAPKISRRNHYLPQFYLRFFATEKNGQLWVYDKQNPEPRLQSPKATAIEVDLYTLVDKHGVENDQLERMFSGLESQTRPILNRWVTNATAIKRSEIGPVAEFLAVMHLRVPRNLAAIREFGGKFTMEYFKKKAQDAAWFNQSYERIVKSTGEPAKIPTEQMRQMMLSPEKHYKLQMDRQYALITTFNQLMPIFEELVSMSWSICEAPEGIFFVTSDAPVNVFAMTGEWQALFGAGFGLPQVEVTFPLSASKSLCISRKRYPPVYRATGNRIIELNRRCVVQAERFLISPYRSNRVKTLITRFGSLIGKEKMSQAEIAKQINL
jgi:hypothetical protein